MFEKYLDNRLITLLLLPFAIGSLSVLSFQPFNFTLINFFILPLFFYLIVYIKKKSKSTYRKKPFKKNLFIFGTSFGFGFFFSGLYWITFSLTFDDSFKFLIPLGLFLIPLFLSLFFSLIVLLIGPLLNFNIISLLLLSASLGASDYFRSKILTGFPWNLWAYSYSWSNEIIQFLNKFGLFAFNLIIITIFTLPAVIFFKINYKKKLVCLFSIPLTLFFLYVYGNYSTNKNRLNLESVNQKYNIKVISPNFELKYGLTIEDLENRLKKLVRISDPIKGEKTLFVWPEGVFSGYSYREIIKFERIFSKNFDKDHYIIFGVNRFNEEKKAYYNSLLVVNKDFKILQEYKKQKLVPFGEFLPFEKFLKKIGLKKITEGHGSFLRGDKQENLKVDEMNILPLICYEIIFTKFIQVSNINSNLIINISEDGWFGNSIGPHQHFAKAIFRSIEHNSFLVRSANKGFSAIINNKGEVIKRLNPNEAGNIELEVPLIKSSNKNRNDLIFFLLLFTYIAIFNFYRKNNDK
tara:strand:- start:322 stop:1884 length:1563 start_codon:yes stop_codon:yes gene_type:complete